MCVLRARVAMPNGGLSIIYKERSCRTPLFLDGWIRFIDMHTMAVSVWIVMSAHSIDKRQDVYVSYRLLPSFSKNPRTLQTNRTSYLNSWSIDFLCTALLLWHFFCLSEYHWQAKPSQARPAEMRRMDVGATDLTYITSRHKCYCRFPFQPA